MFVVRLVRRRAAGQELLAGDVSFLADVVGAVVVEFVIVPGDDPRTQRMRRLQIGIGFVLGKTRPVVVE